MKSKPSSVRFTLLVLFAANLVASGQSPVPSRVDERNVRAAMTFLAGDAMQGRGSGTPFERITAEYVGSQFMQFGLEPAGDIGWDGKPGYIQTVTNSRYTFEINPSLKAGNAIYEHGKEMLIQRMVGSDSIESPLKKIGRGETFDAGAAVLLDLPADRSQDMLLDIQKANAAGASIVIVEETPGYRQRWQELASRKLSYLVTSQSGGKPIAVVIASQEAMVRLRELPDGSMIRVSGKLGSVQKQQTWNAVGKITGSDKALGSEVIVLSSHLDHVGVRENAPGDDKIFNGADDDASGTVAVMELARVIANGQRPKRTVYFVCFGSEESGGHGARYFVDNLPFPLENIVANLEWEMIGRPDPKVNPGELWLTGYERSNLGPELAGRGAKLVQDPHPQENFFQRSDNYTLARRGVIAHTVSSFGLHSDYHRASDELKTIDFAHMTRSINSMVGPIDWLVNSSFRPAWVDGKKP